jgi:peptide/nickel transport system ATP-binding protein
VTSAQPLLEVGNLHVDYFHQGHRIRAVDDLTFAVRPGERLGIVGESGSGKSTVALALLGLLPNSARISGSIKYQGVELVNRPDREVSRVRGSEMALVFQDAKSALDPVRTIGSQILEAIRAHRKVGRSEGVQIAESLLRDVDIPQPQERLRQYPHELSGGMRQRAMIAVALAASPKLLIADEPTSALDVTTQGEVMALLERLCREREMSVILITHDLGVVAGFVDSIVVMYSGAPMEAGPVRDVFRNGKHPYTRALIESIPRLDHGRMEHLHFIPGTLPHPTEAVVGCRFQPRCPVGRDQEICRKERPPFAAVESSTLTACFFPGPQPVSARSELAEPDPPQHVQSRADTGRDAPLFRAEEISKTFTIRKGAGGARRKLRAVTDVSLHVFRGEALGIVGESGSGKTTFARVIVGLDQQDSGTLLLDQQDAARGQKGHRWKPGKVQMIFQDPGDSLDPAMSVEQVVAEPLVITRGKRSEHYRPEVDSLLKGVGLGHHLMSRRPWQLSGGQQQRVAIARALATDPLLLVCDEPVSSLDMSARGQILNLLMDLQRSRQLAVVQISHDLSIVRHTCDRVAVMYAGKVVELAQTDALFRYPQHPYTQALIQAVPIPDPEVERGRKRSRLRGEPPDLTRPLEGCPFRSRCPKAAAICAIDAPALVEHAPQHWSACHFPATEADGSLPVERPGSVRAHSELDG